MLSLPVKIVSSPSPGLPEIEKIGGSPKNSLFFFAPENFDSMHYIYRKQTWVPVFFFVSGILRNQIHQ